MFDKFFLGHLGLIGGIVAGIGGGIILLDGRGEIFVQEFFRPGRIVLTTGGQEQDSQGKGDTT
jgi:hypothetical protein